MVSASAATETASGMPDKADMNHHDGLPPTQANDRDDAKLKRWAKKPLAFHLSVVLLGIIGFIVALDATAMAVTLPSIAQELNGTALESFWVNISFTLAITITQPIYSSTSDILGRKLLLYISLAFFAIGSIVFALGRSMGVVILGRLLQGFGGGGMDVLQVIILSDITTLSERPLYMSIEAGFIAAGAISGPIVGGAFSERISWRWLGWINLPVIGICIGLTFGFLRIRQINEELSQKLRQLDWIGMLLFATGATALGLPLSWANSLYPWSSWRTILPLVAGFVILVIFAFHERTVAKPMIPYRIFKNKTSAAALASGTCHGLVMYTFLLYLPLYFEAVFLETPLDAAISSLPFCASFVIFSSISGLIVNIIRRYRLVLWCGWILSTTFLGLMCISDQSTSRIETYSFQVLAGAGVGTVLTITAIPVQTSIIKVDDTGLAAGTLVVFRLFGALIGLTLSSTAFNSVFRQRLDSAMIPPEALGILGGSNEAVSFITTLKTSSAPQNVLDMIRDVYSISFKTIWIILSAISGLGFLTSLFIMELTLENDDVGRQGLQASTKG